MTHADDDARAQDIADHINGIRSALAAAHGLDVARLRELVAVTEAGDRLRGRAAGQCPVTVHELNGGMACRGC